MTLFRKTICLFTLTAFLGTSFFPPSVAAQVLTSAPNLLSVTPHFEPALVMGMKVFPDNPLRFDFIVDPGQSGLAGEALKNESTKFIKYFLASVTTPDKDMWVNLSPAEKNRIIPEEFGQTLMGQDLLMQDYLLKQLTSSLLYPENELGKKFWEKVYTKAQTQFGQTDIPFETLNRIWIVPDKATVYSKNGIAYITESHMKVMMEEDYLVSRESHLVSRKSLRDTNDEIRDTLRKIILPELEREINEGQTFIKLRQMYQMMILATWFKRNLKESLLGQVYQDQNKIQGVDSADKNAKEKIYQQYLDIFKKGAFDTIKEDYDPLKQEVVSRQYISGGFDKAALAEVYLESAELPKGGLIADHAMIVSADAVPQKGRKKSQKETREIPKLRVTQFPAGSRFLSRLGDADLEKINEKKGGVFAIDWTDDGNLEMIPRNDWYYTETPLGEIDPGNTVLNRVLELNQKRGKNTNIPIVVIDLGSAVGTALSNLNEDLRKLKTPIPNVKFYGLSGDEYTEQWKKMPAGFTFIFDVADHFFMDIEEDLANQGIQKKYVVGFSNLGINHMISGEEDEFVESFFSGLKKLLGADGEMRIFNGGGAVAARESLLMKLGLQLERAGNYKQGAFYILRPVVGEEIESKPPASTENGMSDPAMTVDINIAYNKLKQRVNEIFSQQTTPSGRSVSINDKHDMAKAELRNFALFLLDSGIPLDEEKKTEIKRIFQEINIEIMPKLKLSGMKLASVLPKAEHWLGYAALEYIKNNQIFENRVRRAAQISPETAALILGFMGMHHRVLGGDREDFKISAEIFPVVLAEMERLHRENKHDKELAFYTAMINSLLIGETKEDYPELIQKFLQDLNSVMPNAGEIWERANTEFANQLSIENTALRYHGSDDGQKDIERLAEEPVIVPAIDLVTGKMDPSLRLRKVRFNLVEREFEGIVFKEFQILGEQFNYVTRELFKNAHQLGEPNKAMLVAQQINKQIELLRISLTRRLELHETKVSQQIIKNFETELDRMSNQFFLLDQNEYSQILKRIKNEIYPLLKKIGSIYPDIFPDPAHWDVYHMTQLKTVDEVIKRVNNISPEATALYLMILTGHHLALGVDLGDFPLQAELILKIAPQLPILIENNRQLALVFYRSIINSLMAVTEYWKGGDAIEISDRALDRVNMILSKVRDSLPEIDKILSEANLNLTNDLKPNDILLTFINPNMILDFVSTANTTKKATSFWNLLTDNNGEWSLDLENEWQNWFSVGGFMRQLPGTYWYEWQQVALNSLIEDFNTKGKRLDKEKLDVPTEEITNPAMTAEEIGKLIENTVRELNKHIANKVRIESYQLEKGSKDLIISNLDNFTRQILNSHGAGQLTTEQVRQLFDRVNQQTLPLMRELDIKQAQVLPKAEHWMTYVMMDFYTDLKETKKKLRSLGQISPEAAALFLGMIGMHHRRLYFDENDLELAAVLLEIVLPEIDALLNQGDEVHKQQAKRMYTAVLNSFLLGNYSIDKAGHYTDFVNGLLTASGVSNAKEILKRAADEFKDQLSFENLAFRYYGPANGRESLNVLAQQKDIVSAWDLVSGVLDPSIRLDRPYHLMGEYMDGETGQQTEFAYGELRKQFKYLTVDMFTSSGNAAASNLTDVQPSADTAMTAAQINQKIAGLERDLEKLVEYKREDKVTLQSLARAKDDVANRTHAMMYELMEGYVNKTISLTEVKDILEKVDGRILPRMKTLEIKMEKVLPKAEHWLAYVNLRSFATNELLEKHIIALSEISPEATALAVGMMGPHQRAGGYDTHDLKVVFQVMPVLLQRMHDLLAEGKREEAKRYYTAIINSLLSYTYRIGAQTYEDFISEKMIELNQEFPNALTFWQEAADTFGGEVTIDNPALRFQGTLMGDKDIRLLAQEAEPVSAWDLVSGAVNGSIQLTNFVFISLGDSPIVNKSFERLKTILRFLTHEIYDGMKQKDALNAQSVQSSANAAMSAKKMGKSFEIDGIKYELEEISESESGSDIFFQIKLEDGTKVGSLRAVSQYKSSDFKKIENAYRLERLFVEPDFRYNGLGKILMAKLIEKSLLDSSLSEDKRGMISVHANGETHPVSGKTAVDYYLGLGFETLFRQSRYVASLYIRPEKAKIFYQTVKQSTHFLGNSNDSAQLGFSENENNVGGIDFNSNRLNLNSQGEAIKYNIPPEYQNVDFNNVTGFTPVIFQMVPITNLPLFLGVSEKDKETERITMK